MKTTDTINGYFHSLKQQKGWDEFFSEDMIFTSFMAPPRRIGGRAEYLEATKGFYSMITGFEIKKLIVDAHRACALTHYELQPLTGPAFGSDVAEIFEVRDGKISSLDIYFDSAPFPK